MANVVAKFEKVSFEQFSKDWMEKDPTHKYKWTESELRYIYDNIQLPKRSTAGSAGYDFRAPADFTVTNGNAAVIPTGIRCRIENDWFLDINPRSGQGFKMGIRLANTRGIIDSDYYGADNEGHIMIKITNESNIANGSDFSVKEGDAFAQGIFTMYGITEDDDATAVRTGGMGSTTKSAT